MLYLGWAYQKGVGIAADARQAEVWLRRAFEKGSKLVIYYLGDFYWQQQEYSKAHEVFAVGVSMQYTPAIYCFGRMYVEETGVGKQPDKARVLMEQATALGHLFAKRSLARLLMSGQFGLFNVLRGYSLFFGALKDFCVVVMKEGASSDRLCG